MGLSSNRSTMGFARGLAIPGAFRPAGKAAGVSPPLLPSPLSFALSLFPLELLRAFAHALLKGAAEMGGIVISRLGAGKLHRQTVDKQFLSLHQAAWLRPGLGNVDFVSFSASR